MGVKPLKLALLPFYLFYVNKLILYQQYAVSWIKSRKLAYLNPNEIPVITADQPIYAVLKQIQWQWPEQYGENKLNFVIIFGGLHIEMAALKSIGTLLQSSGWTSVIVEAGIASSGTAESFLSASSVTVLLEYDKPTRSRLAACTSFLRMPMNITATKLL